MNTKWFVILSLMVVALTVMTACGGGAAEASEVFVETEQPADEYRPAGQPAEGLEGEKSASEPMPSPGEVFQTLPDTDNLSGNALFVDRMIIKNAEVSVLVEDSDIAIDRLTQIVSDVGGYIVSSRIWYQDHYDGESYKYATITLGIPVDRFEVTMRRVRGLALKVLDENASGEDVTDQFVDLESRLANLEATQARIQTFLEEAKSVDEALRINEELSQVEAQIEEVKGRMKYLSNRAAFSTITVTISPELPEIEPPKPHPWTPGDTLQDAFKTLVKAYQGITEFVIWLVVAILPILVPPLLVIWLLVKLVRRKPAKQVPGNGN